jgi:hypothetical protein
MSGISIQMGCAKFFDLWAIVVGVLPYLLSFHSYERQLAD